jgi:hypothetical protein|tara:strand:+ start:483 stop:731 length:249 start_codon:yes stop_codon:yes gene_type:complete
MGIITTTISSSTAAISLTGSVTSDGLISAYGFGNTTQISGTITTHVNHNYVLYGPIYITGSQSTLTVGTNTNIKIINLADAS